MTDQCFGWAGQILEVDLSREQIRTRRLPDDLCRNFIGQSGINAALLHRQIQPGLGALSPEAPLIFGVGPLGGTMAPCSGRFSLTFKSPLTGIFADSNCGGHFGPELKMAGYDHILITGQARRPVYLFIDNDAVSLVLCCGFVGSVQAGRYRCQALVPRPLPQPAAGGNRLGSKS